jgi:hypothetical protein
MKIAGVSLTIHNLERQLPPEDLDEARRGFDLSLIYSDLSEGAYTREVQRYQEALESAGSYVGQTGLF